MYRIYLCGLVACLNSVAMESAPKRQKVRIDQQTAVSDAERYFGSALETQGVGRFVHIAKAIEVLRDAQLSIDFALAIPDLCGIYDKKSMLSWSAYYQEPDLVATLLEQGASVGSHDHWGRTPLHNTFLNHVDGNPSWQQEVVGLLLDSGAPIESYDTLGYQPIHYAAMISPGGWRCLPSLIKKGARVNAQALVKGKPSATPLHGALDHQQEESVRVLLEKGACLSIQNAAGKDCLEYASEILDYDAFDLLEERVRVEDWIMTGEDIVPEVDTDDDNEQ